MEIVKVKDIIDVNLIDKGIEKVKDIIDVNLIDKGIVKVTYSDSTSETIETQPLINTVNKVRGEVLEIDKRLKGLISKLVSQMSKYDK
jgi:hypothetical protein